MTRLTTAFALCLLTFAFPLPAAQVETVAGMVRLLSGREAAFTQRFLPRGYKKEQVETGRVVFGEAPASRWSYLTPEEKTFVFDGERSWMYVPADATVMTHRVTGEEKNRLPFFVLSDPSKLEDWYEVSEKNGRLRLEAKDDQALLRSIELEIEPSGTLRTISYVDSQGNRTAFELRDWKRAETSAETFTFTPPPGVDVIDN